MKDGDTIKEVDATFSSPVQGLTLRLTHKNNPNRTFEGKIDGGVGNITWKGKTELLKGLTDLHITGAMAGSNLTIDLAPGADDMLRGPVLLKSGNTEVFRANAGLRLTGERFGIVLDIANPEDPKVSTHAEIDITGKRSPWSGEIKIPSPTTPLRTVTDELSKNTRSYDTDGSGQDTPLTSSDSTGYTVSSTGRASQK